MAATRQARAVWEGDLITGKGTVDALSSGRFTGLPVSWASRTEASKGQSSPEELLSAAHASCFAMALSHGLAGQGMPPTRLEVSATVTFDKVGAGWAVTASELEVKGVVKGIDQASFKKAADDAKDGCPISVALKGNVELSVKASLVSS